MYLLIYHTVEYENKIMQFYKNIIHITHINKNGYCNLIRIRYTHLPVYLLFVCFYCFVFCCCCLFDCLFVFFVGVFVCLFVVLLGRCVGAKKKT